MTTRWHLRRCAAAACWPPAMNTTTEPDHAVEACEHLKETAHHGQRHRPRRRPRSPRHKRFEVTLLDGGIGGKTGTVRFQVPKAGHLLVFLTADVPVKVTNPNGGELTAGGDQEDRPLHRAEGLVRIRGRLWGRTPSPSAARPPRVNSVGLVVETEEHAH